MLFAIMAVAAQASDGNVRQYAQTICEEFQNSYTNTEFWRYSDWQCKVGPQMRDGQYTFLIYVTVTHHHQSKIELAWTDAVGSMLNGWIVPSYSFVPAQIKYLQEKRKLVPGAA